MASSIQIPVTQVGLEQSIQDAMKSAGKGAQINLGASAQSISSLSQPLGKITGQADQFTKSMEAANARVFAFGASVGVIGAVSKALSSLVADTIKVEKSLADINSVLGVSSGELQKFGNVLFDVAKNTGQSFNTVAEGALELARQGLSTEETLKRINDALVLSRLSGLSAADSVEGLTAAYNSFASTGITMSEIVNKMVAVSQKYSVSERDLVEGLKRSASVAKQAGVSFDQLTAIITSVQSVTARGGAVIGNSLKTIFSKIQDKSALNDLQDLGVEVTEASGKILPAIDILENLSKTFTSLGQTKQIEMAKKLGGTFQLSNLLAMLQDLGAAQSKYGGALTASQNAGNEAYAKNAALNETMAAMLNKVSVSAEQLGATLGKIGVTDNLKNILDWAQWLLDGLQKILDQKGPMGDFVGGLAKGIGALVSGPGLALFGAVIAKLSVDLVKFGFSSLKGFFGVSQAAKEIQAVEQSIIMALSQNAGLQEKLFSLEGNRAAQLRLISEQIALQEASMRRMASMGASLGAPLFQSGVRSTPQGLRVPENKAEGYLPAVSAESNSIQQGVGGARSGDKPVMIPNFAFGGGVSGPMVAHTGEVMVPNFANGGTAIFNRDMIASMGMPAGAQKIGAAGGFIPNFANYIYDSDTLSSEQKKEFMQQVLSSKVTKDVILGPSGAGKSTLAAKTGTFIKSLEDIKNATKFTILSGAGMVKAGGMSPALQEIVNSVKTSGGTLSYLNVADDEIKNRRAGRTTANGDLRSESALKGTSYAPLNNPDFIDLLKKELGIHFKMVNGAAGYIPNFAKKDDPSNRDLILDASKLGGIGTASISLEGTADQRSTTSTAFNTLSSSEQDILSKIFPEQFRKGAKSYQTITLKNIEARTLKSMQGSGDAQHNFRKKINQHMGQGMVNFAEEMFGKTFKGQNHAEMAAQIKNEENDPAIFSDAVIGGIFEGITRIGTKSMQGLGVFKQADNPAFDFERGEHPEPGFLQAFGFSDIARADAKKTGSDSATRTMIGKSLRDSEVQKNIMTAYAGVTAQQVENLHSELFPKIEKSEETAKTGKTLPQNWYQEIPIKGKSGTYTRLPKAGEPRDYAEAEYIRRHPEYAGATGAKGYIPNFADPIQAAISREQNAGVPSSQIYVDSSPSLVNSSNPMGMMVANRRDEPSGGSQGISRAISEGRNPQTYGAANGFVPNYARYGKKTFVPPTTAAASGGATTVSNDPQSADDGSVEPQAKKAQKDMLGTIFAVQAGLSLLSGAFSDAEKGIGKSMSILTSAMSNMTSVVFAMEGIKNITKDSKEGSWGAMGGKIAQFAGAAAIAGIVLNQTGALLQNIFVPSSKKAAENLLAMSDSVQKASASLSQFELGAISASNKKEGPTSFATASTAFGRMVGMDAFSSVKTGENIKTTNYKGNVMKLTNIGEEEFAQTKENYLKTYVGANKKSGATNEDVEGLIKKAEDSFDKLALIGKYSLDPKKSNYIQGSVTDQQVQFETEKLASEAGLNKGILTIKEQETIIDQERLKKSQQIIENVIKEQQLKLGNLSATKEQLMSESILHNLSKEQVDDLNYSSKVEDLKVNRAKEELGIILQQFKLLDGQATSSEERLYIQKQIISMSSEDLQSSTMIEQMLKRVLLVNKSYVDSAGGLNKAGLEHLEALKIDLGFRKSGFGIAKQQLDVEKTRSQVYKNQLIDIQKITAERQSQLTLQAASKSYESQGIINKASTQVLGVEGVIKSGNLTLAQQKALEDTKANLEYSKKIEAAKKSEEEFRSSTKLSVGKLSLPSKGYDTGAFSQIEASSKDIPDLISKLNDKYNEAVTGKKGSPDDRAKLKEEIDAIQINFNKNQQEIENQRITASAELNNSLIKELPKEMKTQLADLFANLKLAQDIENLNTTIATSISGKTIAESEYDRDTKKRQLEAKTPDERNAIEKARKVKDYPQLFKEAFSTTEQERANTYMKALVDGAVKFKETMISAIVDSIDSGASLGKVLQNAAYNYAKEMNKASLNKLFDASTGGIGNAASGVGSFISNMLPHATGGPITGGSGTKDDVPAVLMGGEYVINKQSAGKYGPAFLNAINGGTLKAFAAGGVVSGAEYQSGPQGNYYVPGQYGSGAISGGQSNLDFATQTSTTGAYDSVTNRGNYANISLEGESSQLTNFGRRTGPMAQTIASAKQQSFDLYLQGYREEQAQKEAAKKASKALQRQLLIMAITTAASMGAGAMAGGAKAAFEASKAAGGTTGQNVWAGMKGTVMGGDVMGTNVGGLKNLFSGNFGLSQIGNKDQLEAYNLKNSIANGTAITGTPKGSMSGGSSVIPGGNLGYGAGYNGTQATFPSGGYDGSSSMVLPGKYASDDEAIGDLAKIYGYSSSINGEPTKRATGGSIPSSAGIDNVSAALSGGEFVMNSAATQNLGAGNLQSLNSGASDLPTQDSADEANAKIVEKLDELIKATGSSGAITINVDGATGKSTTDREGSGNASDAKSKLAQQIKDAVIKVIQDEKRLGGSLRR